MDQGRFKITNQTKPAGQQGRYGENNASGLGERWICPECETINTENQCILCGHQKNSDPITGDNSGKTKKRFLICSLLVFIIAGGILTWIITNRKSENIGVYGAMHEETADVQVGVTTVPMHEVITVQKATDNAWTNNILMDCSDEQEMAFGTNIPREKIASVTFLDTTLEAPDTAWDVSEEKNKTILAWTVKNGTLYDLHIAGDGGISAPHMNGLFANFYNLRTVNFNDCVHTSLTTDMSNLFSECKKLTELDLSSIDTSNVENMNAMFYNCSKLNELDLSSFDTSNVVSMNSMFYGCTNLKYVDIHSFNTEKVFSMGSMFYGCENLLSVELDNFVTTYVHDMNSMFYNCYKLTTIDLSSFDTRCITDMNYMFNGNSFVIRPDGTHDFLGPHEIIVDEPKFDLSNVQNHLGFMQEGAKINGRPWEEFVNPNSSSAYTNDVVLDIPEEAFLWNAHHYAVFDHCQSWEEAAVYCKSRGGHLATITSAEENAAVFLYISENGYKSAYFGLSDSAMEGSWYWITGETVDFLNWHAGEPNGESSEEDYAMFYYKFEDGTWNDGEFGSGTTNGGMAFICEWD